VLENSTIYEELIDNLVLASDVCCLGLVPNESNTLIFQPPQCSPISRCAMRAPFASSLRIHAYQLRCFQHAASRRTPIQQAIEAAYYRGGTSRAVMIQPQHLPVERAKWPTIFRQIMGSGDPYGRQLDGMGAGISSLSKICLVEPHGKGVPKDAGAHGEEQELDIDYTFVGLGIENDEVDVAGNCGNMSSAIGPYAYNAGLLPLGVYEQRDGEVTVKFRNTNTGKLIDSTFEVVGGQAAVVGDYTIDGVTGNGSKIKLDFKHPYGSKTGKVLPTGNTVDEIEGYEVSCVDLLERIRKSAAVAMGIAPREDLVPRTIPKIGLVSKSSKHMVLSGQTLAHTQMDLVVRFLSDTQPHRAIPLTAALTTAVAARIPGTIVQQLLAFSPVMGDAITIGHASGRLQVNAKMEEKDPLTPLSATVYRTAKRLFEGKVYWTDMGGSSGDEMKYGSGGIHSLGLAFVLDSRG
jgi:2-methylaconitate cis-trans-isomerase PrpF